MEIYYIIFAVLIFATLIFDTLPSRLSALLEFALFFALTVYLLLFAGLRTMGLEYDYSGYKSIFYEISGITNLSEYSGYSIELGYKLFNRLFRGYSFYTFTFALALISVLPKVIYIYKRCNKKFLALAYYYAFVLLQLDMGLLRVSIASGILYYGFDFLAKDEKGKFLLTILFASFFHQTSFLMILLLPLGSKKYSLRTYLYVLGLGFLVSLMHVGKPLLNISLRIFAGGNLLIEKLEGYYVRMAGAELAESTITRLILSNARKLIIFLMFSYLLRIADRSYGTEECQRLRVWYNSYFVAILFPLMFVDLGGAISHRGALLFRPVEIFLFSELYDVLGKRKAGFREIFTEKILLLMFIIFLCFHNFNDVIHSYSGFIPYEWNL